MHNAPAASVDAKRKSRPSSSAQDQDNAPDSNASPASSTRAAASRLEQGAHDAALTLRGTNRGLEVWIGANAPAGPELAKLLQEQLEQSPSFFSGGDAILHFASAPKPGVISALEAKAQAFDLRVVAVHTASIQQNQEPAPRLSQRKAAAPPTPAPKAPAPKPPQPRAKASAQPQSPYPRPAPRYASAYREVQKQIQDEVRAEVQAKVQEVQARATPMMIPGPIRSGSCFEAPGHLVVVGDVNPGAEIRAEGNIVVLGSLRGIAHAGTQGGPAFILALKLQPQQLRIGTLIARAGDSDNPASGAEVAYAADQMIVVDEYQGRLPSNIANSI